MISGVMGEYWPQLRKIAIVFVVVAGLCFAGIQIFAPSPAASLAGRTDIAPGVIADVSFTGAPTGLAIWISLFAGLTVILAWRALLLVGHPRSPLRGLLKLRRAESGQAITEFVIIFPALFMTVMGICQLSLMYNAKSVTLYAAYSAARSAIVWVPQDADDGDGPGQITVSTSNEKYGMVQQSAALACVPISRRASHVLGSLPIIGSVIMSVVNAIDSILQSLPLAMNVFHWGDRYAYSYVLTNVHFIQETPQGPQQMGSYGDQLQFGPHQDVTVQVNHCLHLPIPLVAQIIDRFSTLPQEFMLMEWLPGSYTNVSATCTLTVETA